MLTLLALVNRMASAVVLWIVPPEPLFAPPPSPAMVKPPVAPVLLRAMPLVPPFWLTLLKVTPEAPIVALVMLTAVPAVTALVAPTVLLAFVTLMVRPAPEAEKTLAVLFSVI